MKNKERAHHEKIMDRNYQFQRFFYDTTRKFFLPGRDILIREMNIKPWDHVLEIGCGTCRNLILLARRYINVQFYGLDASREMLKSARSKIRNHGFEARINLAQGLAENLDPALMFERQEPFNIIFFSYSLTMIPGWKQSLETACRHLQHGGYLYVVDFWNQEKLPVWLRKIIKSWLQWFHVRHDPEMIPFLQELAVRHNNPINIESMYGQYSFKASLHKIPS